MTSESKSKIEDVLRGEKNRVVPGAAEPPVLQSELDKELGAEDTQLARDLQRTRAEEIIARRRNAIARMTGGGGQGAAPDEGGKVKSEERGKDWLVNYTAGLLEKGMEPAIVGRLVDYMLGGNQFPSVGMPGNGTPAGGMSFTDMKEIFKMGQEANKTDPVIAQLLARLTEKVEAVEKAAAVPRPPAQSEKRTFFVLKPDGQLEEVPFDKPIVQMPKPEAADKKSIEEIHEENRHAEEKERIRVNEEHKKGLVNTLADLTENAGRGFASMMMNQEEGDETKTEAAANTEEQELFKCPDCNKEFMVPKTATSISCLYCTKPDGTPNVFERKKIEEAKK